MDENKHGKRLVELLAESDAELKSVTSFSQTEGKVDGYSLQTLFLTYEGSNEEKITLGITLVKVKAMHKRHEPTTYYHLTAVNLDKGIVSEDVIDNLLKPRNGMPVLITWPYVIAEGKSAKEMYNQLDGDIPSTAKELATMLGQYIGQHINRNTFSTHQRPESLFPDPQMRINLGRY